MGATTHPGPTRLRRRLGGYKGTLLFRLLPTPNEAPPWRAAKPADLDTWPTTFRAFAEERIALCEKKLAEVWNG